MNTRLFHVITRAAASLAGRAGSTCAKEVAGRALARERHSAATGSALGRWIATVLLLSSPYALADYKGNKFPGTSSGFTDVINKAPIAFDGDVQGAQTDIVVNFRVPQDPEFDGIALLAGESIVVHFPAAFEFDDEGGLFPVCDLATTPPDCPNVCTPGTLECTTAVFLRGWPQSPQLPGVEMLPGNRLKVTAKADVISPFAKQLHLIAKGFKNPRAGHYRLTFERLDASGVVRGRGESQVEILRRVGSSINVFSVPAGGNTIYQRAAVNSSPPRNWFFLMWDRRGEPLTDLSLKPLRGDRYRMLSGKRPVGQVTLHVPEGASGHKLEIVDELGPITTPIIGTGPGGAPAPLVQRYEFRFTSGDTAGGYEAEFNLFHGNRISMFVEVDE